MMEETVHARWSITLVLAVSLAASASARESTEVAESSLFSPRGSFFALRVADLTDSVRWYRETMGLELKGDFIRHNDVTVAILEGDGLIVELIENPSAVAAQEEELGLFKVGIIVADWEGFLGKLRERKVPIEIGPFACRTDQRANLIIRDNNGNLIQFFGPHCG